MRAVQFWNAPAPKFVMLLCSPNTTHETVTVTKRHLRNALKFGQTGEVNSKEGEALAQGLLAVRPGYDSEVGAPQGELNGTMGEALIQHPPHQCLRTKLIFDVGIDDQFLD